MINRKTCYALLAAGLLSNSFSFSVFAEENAQPNIIHIFVDDLGYGGVGYTNNPLNFAKTPNIDALAAGGMVFNQAYAAATCTPSRAVLTTGFHNGHTLADRNRDNDEIGGTFRADEISVAHVLKDAGYTTGVFGKHGFGGTEGSGTLKSGIAIDDPLALPTTLGYDEFFGYLDQTRAHNYFVDELWETHEGSPHRLRTVATGNTLENPRVSYSHDQIATRSLQYVQSHASDDNPFYMQLNYTIPHSKLGSIDDAPAINAVDQKQPAGRGQYANHPTLSDNQERYAAMVSRMDASIGHLIEKLKDPNSDGDQSDSILENTMIIFTSDNGSTAEDGAPHQSFDLGGPYRGGKRDLFEGGIHVPGIAFWQGQIAAGSSTDLRTDVADFLPTAAELAGVDAPVGIDGVSILPTLTGKGFQRKRDYLIFEHHEKSGPDPDNRSPRWAIIRGDMKLIEFSNGDQELYHLVNDPGETAALDLTDVTYDKIRDDLQAIAWAEGVERPDGYAAYRQFWKNGETAGVFDDASRIGGRGVANINLITVLDNQSDQASSIDFDEKILLLGFEIGGSKSNQRINIAGDAIINARNQVRVASGGHIDLQNGSKLETLRWVDILEDGQITGSGKIVGDVYSAGIFDPDEVEITGNYYQITSGKLKMSILGNDQGGALALGHDQLTVTGKAVFGGTLQVQLLDQFSPEVGDSYLIVDANAYEGRFDTVELPGLDDGRHWDLSALYTEGKLQVLDYLKGDVNDDGAIDQSDLDLLLEHLGQSHIGLDLDGDNVITQGDIDVVRANWGIHGAIPEPSSVGLLLVSAAMLGHMRLHR